MSRLGFERSTGFVYEGRGDPIYPAWPTPIISQATLIETPDDLKKIPTGFDSHPHTWMFREDFFDPVSRIRRGRLFQKHGNQGWEPAQVEAHPAVHSDTRRVGGGNGALKKELSVYIECTDLLSKERKGQGMQLAIGVFDAHSLWRILQTERTANQDILVTLRAESAFAILPEIDGDKVSPETLPQVLSAMNRVLDAAYRELPSSVVDQCRNAVGMIASRWMHQEMNNETPVEKDLGQWIGTIREHFKEKPRHALCAALEIINKLHPRGKDNELMRLNLRPVTEGDAELSVYLTGFVLREIGWAKP